MTRTVVHKHLCKHKWPVRPSDKRKMKIYYNFSKKVNLQVHPIKPICQRGYLCEGRQTVTKTLIIFPNSPIPHPFDQQCVEKPCRTEHGIWTYHKEGTQHEQNVTNYYVQRTFRFEKINCLLFICISLGPMTLASPMLSN